MNPPAHPPTPPSRRELLRRALGQNSEPYAGADISTSRRFSALLVLLSGVLTLAFAPIMPPDEPIGDAGWLVLAAIVVVQLGVARRLADEKRSFTFGRLLLISYAGLASVAALEWLAGGHGPYAVLLMLWLGAGVGIHPPRRAALFLLAVVAVEWLPLLYGGWNADDARSIAAQSLLWLAIGAVLVVLIATFRAQRVHSRAVERTARADAEEAAKRVRDLQQVTDAALAQLPLDELLRELLSRISDVLDLDAAAILLLEENGQTLAVRAAHGFGDDQTDRVVRVPVGEGCAGRVAAERRTVLLEDVGDARDLDPLFRSTQVRTLAGVPLIADDKVIGVIEVGSERRRGFSPHDIRLLGLAAERLSQAIERARYNERAHEISATLQRALLPDRLPRVPGVALAARYLPGGPGTDVGGDWYDVVPYQDGRVGLVMGDVVGRGVTAASLMGQLRNALRVYALDLDRPAAILDRVNVLLHRFEPGQMATAVDIVFDPAEGSLCFAGAGHPPPLVRMPDGTAEFLRSAPSAPLGVLPYTRYHQQSASLPAGATLLLYTDGLVERPGTSLSNGLRDLLDATRSGPAEPEALCEHVLRTMLPGGAPGDDVALLALQHAPIVGDVLHLDVPADPDELALVRHSLARWLAAASVEDRDAYRVTLAANEACMNAVEHSFAPRDSQLHVDATLKGDAVDIVVRDHGRWREPREGTGGRGLAMMRQLMDEVDVTPAPGGTTVHLRRAVTRGAAG